jgi:hypothetical protein
MVIRRARTSFYGRLRHTECAYYVSRAVTAHGVCLLLWEQLRLMVTLRWTPSAQTEYEELRRKAQAVRAARGAKGSGKSSRAEGLFKQVHKTLVLLYNNPKHPGLESLEYHSIDNPFDASQKVFEAYAQSKTPGAYRVLWCFGPGKKEITIIAITPRA